MTRAELQELAPYLSEEALEVVLEALQSGARLVEREGELWYDDPYYGDPVPLKSLYYDPELGLTHRERRRP